MLFRSDTLECVANRALARLRQGDVEITVRIRLIGARKSLLKSVNLLGTQRQRKRGRIGRCHVDVPLTQARERSVRDTLKGVEKWLGSLDESEIDRSLILALRSGPSVLTSDTTAEQLAYGRVVLITCAEDDEAFGDAPESAPISSM